VGFGNGVRARKRFSQHAEEASGDYVVYGVETFCHEHSHLHTSERGAILSPSMTFFLPFHIVIFDHSGIDMLYIEN